MYIGTDKGVVTLQTKDGYAWETESQGLQSWAVPSVAFVPGEPNKVIAGTRGDGVWVSEDAGKSWTKPSYGRRGPGKVRCVAVDPKNPQRIYAGCEPIDIFVSEDQGKNWERIDSVWDDPFVATVPYPVAVVEPHVRDIAIDPNEPNVLYAALQVGYILKSTDAGRTWKLLNKNVDCDVHTIVIDPSNTQNVYIATGGHDSRSGRAPGRALYASADGGESWAPKAMNFTREYSVPLTMSPTNPKVLYSSLANGQPNSWRGRPGGAESLLIRSQDGGESWEQLSRGLAGADKEFAEAIVIDREQPSRIYAAQRGGDIYASEDAGDSWSSVDVRVPGVASAKLARFS
jgi:photosystem II stability/assembly factor-like uncharacterized protein